MKKIIILCGLATLTALVLAGCGGGSGGMVKANDEDNGGRVEMKVGGTLEIELESNPTTGYTWQVIESGAGVLEQTGASDYTSDSEGEGAVGVGGTETFTFEAIAAGEVTLELAYMRPWETEEEPADTFTLTVEVR